MRATTASTTPCCKELECRARLKTLLLLVLSLLLGTQAPAVRAEASITPRDLALEQVNEVYTFRGGFDIQLGSLQEEVLASGVPLHFLAEFQVLRPRRWWWNEEVATVTRVARLQYNILLRQYSVTIGGRQKAFDTLPRALDLVSDLSGWQVLDRRILQSDQNYVARVRMRIDVSQLPKPLQVNALASSRWELDSGRLEWFLKP
jgi:hypothetical protein